MIPDLVHNGQRALVILLTHALIAGESASLPFITLSALTYHINASMREIVSFMVYDIVIAVSMVT